MNKTMVFFLFVSLFFAACGDKPASNPDKPANGEPDLTIVVDEKVGLITPTNCTREAVLAAYGKDAKVDSVYIAQGVYGEGVVVYPENRRRRMEVYWHNEFDSIRPALIRISGDGTGTDWKTSEGVTIGTPMSEIQRLNGKPFQVTGFGVDYGGFPTDWNGGKLSTALLFRFQPTANDPGSEKVQGEGSYSSDQPEMLAAKPQVAVMLFRFLTREKLPDCLMEKIKANKVGETRMKVYNLPVGGSYHYWLQSGAAAYDGIEYIYDSECKEVCKAGMRKRPECMKPYEGGKWKLVWEE